MKDFKEEQRKHYNKLAKEFDEIQKRENRNHINKIKAISDFLKIEEGERVLEIGVGTGIHADYLQRLNHIDFYFTGLDLSKEMLTQAKKRLNKYKRINLKKMDGERLLFKTNTFDKVYVSGSLHHFPNPGKGINEITRVLKKGGKFCIMEPNYLFPINFYSANMIKEEKNIKLMSKRNFVRWLSSCPVSYKITNFAYTPPFPKFLIELYDLMDKTIEKIPLLKRFSIMFFIRGRKGRQYEI